jgi:2-desacetyl-2-hydroxyethyl bacteriochlorophyllide A dehydrogenase
MKAKELWFTSPGKTELKFVTIDDPKNDEVLVKASYSLISSGTERLVSGGNIPATIFNQMKVPYMQGEFSFPFTYGYSLVGEIIKGEKSLLGKYVHILHPHKEIALVKIKDVYILPESFNLQTATLASNMETAVNAVWDSGVSIGDKVLIVGFGIIGSLLAGVLKSMKHIHISIHESNQERAEIARKLGFEIIEKTQNNDFDLAFNTSANANGLQLCIDSVGFEGKVTELSWYGDENVNINLGGDFHSKRKAIIASQVSKLPSQKTNRWDFLRRKKLVFEILKDEYFSLLPISDIPFSNCESLYENKIQVNNYLGFRIKY